MMAYINVSEWTPDHVAEWLRGLEGCILPYVHFFLNNNVDGRHLLNLSPDDLNGLHISKIGHQELILESVDLLRQLHYGLTSETLQFLALKLGCKARSLHNDLRLNGPQDSMENVKQERVSTDTLSAVSDILISVKSLVSWLDRFPFEHQDQYISIKRAVLKLSIELASTAQRDQFVDKPHLLLKSSSLHLAELCDKVVQDFNDSLIIQPASLDIATIKKKPDEELGMHITSTYSGIHIISSIKPQSPATRCTKIEEGDEIVQVNYQTVTGWHLKSFLEAMKEHPTEIHLTLKKRPRHTNILGQIIILRPYRIPSKKTAFGKVHKWSEGNSSLHIQETYSISNNGEDIRNNNTNDDDDDDSAFLPDNTGISSNNVNQQNIVRYRMFATSSHTTVQRRATVSGASPTVLKAPVNIEDLVSGVPIIRRKENISRSVSHDPSKLNASVQKSSVLVETCVKTKSKDLNESSEKMLTKSDNSQTRHSEGDASSKFSSCGATVKCDKSSVKASDILAVQEEEYTILENKSLEKLKDSIPPNTSAIVKSSDKAIKGNYRQDLTSCVISQDENVSTSCHSAHSSEDITNDPMALDLFHLNPISGQRVMLNNSENKTSSSAPIKKTSYQIVVVGAVPQEFMPKTCVQKCEKDAAALQQKRKTGIVGRFENRRISCKDLGMGDCQGWLYKLKDSKRILPSVSQWTKRWIILKNHYLYSYCDKSDRKAECLIFLPGSTVSPTLGCKSKKYCFKVCQSNTAFYFATETQCDLSKWMNKMGLAAIAYDATSDITTSGFLKPEVVLGVENTFYSETDDSDDSSCKGFSQVCCEKISLSEPKPMHATSLDYTYLQQKNVDRFQLKSAFLNPRGTSVYSYEANNSASDTKSLNNFTYLSEHSVCHNEGVSAKEVFTEISEKDTTRISYARSFSCTESTNSPLANEKFDCLARKMSYDDAGNLYGDRKLHCISSTISDEYDILSSSLGRQKSLAKEITPGLVARMAVSYNNLSHKSAVITSSSGSTNKFKDVPAPGYVAKISDSFDHLARNCENSKLCQPTKCKSSCKQPSLNTCVNHSSNSSCKRSASESQVSQTSHNSSHKMPSSYLISEIDPSIDRDIDGEDSSIPGKLVSRLDRDHYRLYGRKKVSPQSMKSSPDSLHHSKGKETVMRFFPEPGKVPEVNQNHVNNKNSNIPLESVVQNQHPETASRFLKFGAIGLHSHADNSALSVQYSSEVHKQPFSSLLGSHGFKSQIQSVFRPQSKKQLSDFSKGIENIGFHSVDQAKSSSHREKQADLNSPAVNPSETYNRQSSCYGNSLNTFYSKCEIESCLPPKSATLDSSVSKLNSPFKLFGSPKFMKKLSSPKLDRKNIFKSKKQAKEIKKAEQKECANLQSERKLFGSPRLARAIFGSPKSPKKYIVTISSGVQTDDSSVYNYSSNDTACFNNAMQPGKENKASEHVESAQICLATNLGKDQFALESVRTSSNSSLNSDASSSVLSASTTSSNFYGETRIKPQVTVSLPVITSKKEDNTSLPEPSRTPLKPTMGISMLGKRRLPSVGESSISLLSSKSSNEETLLEPVEQLSEISAESDCDEMVHILEALRKAHLSVDGVDLRARRCRTILMHFGSKHINQLVLELRALQRTLKDKESELAAIDQLFTNSVIDHDLLASWIAAHSDVFL